MLKICLHAPHKIPEQLKLHCSSMFFKLNSMAPVLDCKIQKHKHQKYGIIFNQTLLPIYFILRWYQSQAMCSLAL